jgi:predicted lipoprotein
VALAALAPETEAASPEREAIRALIDEAAPRLATETKALQRATERYASNLKPSAATRSAVTRAIATQVAELKALYEKVASSPVTTELSRDAQRLSLETIQLTQAYLTSLGRAVHAKSESGALRALRASRKALDKSLQTGINARAALTIQ